MSFIYDAQGRKIQVDRISTLANRFRRNAKPKLYVPAHVAHNLKAQGRTDSPVPPLIEKPHAYIRRHKLNSQEIHKYLGGSWTEHVPLLCEYCGLKMQIVTWMDPPFCPNCRSKVQVKR